MCCCCPSIELIIDALDQAKHRFYKDTKQAHDEQSKDLVVAQTQCDSALRDAISTLSNMQKNKKRALKKKKNLNLKNGIEAAYKQLTQLQLYSGYDKILRCFEFAIEWSGRPANNTSTSRGAATSTTVQTPPVATTQPFVTESEQPTNGSLRPRVVSPIVTDQTPPVKNIQPSVTESGEPTNDTSRSYENSPSTPKQTHPVQNTQPSITSSGQSTNDTPRPGPANPGITDEKPLVENIPQSLVGTGQPTNTTSGSRDFNPGTIDETPPVNTALISTGMKAHDEENSVNTTPGSGETNSDAPKAAEECRSVAELQDVGLADEPDEVPGLMKEPKYAMSESEFDISPENMNVRLVEKTEDQLENADVGSIEDIRPSLHSGLVKTTDQPGAELLEDKRVSLDVGIVDIHLTEDAKPLQDAGLVLESMNTGLIEDTRPSLDVGLIDDTKLLLDVELLENSKASPEPAMTMNQPDVELLEGVEPLDDVVLPETTDHPDAEFLDDTAALPGPAKTMHQLDIELLEDTKSSLNADLLGDSKPSLDTGFVEDTKPLLDVGHIKTMDKPDAELLENTKPSLDADLTDDAEHSLDVGLMETRPLLDVGLVDISFMEDAKPTPDIELMEEPKPETMDVELMEDMNTSSDLVFMERTQVQPDIESMEETKDQPDSTDVELDMATKEDRSENAAVRDMVVTKEDQPEDDRASDMTGNSRLSGSQSSDANSLDDLEALPVNQPEDDAPMQSGIRSRDPSFHRRVTKDVSSPNLWQNAKMIFSLIASTSNGEQEKQ
ncbi:hypothetical protein BGX34_002953 [Mortierella sp. NVP85]|nr:hypothetical protein BGX34_002953 [Mortierella sp. NVP85]